MTTKHRHVEKQIKSWILSGKIQPHEQIQTEHILAQMFRVSRHTIRQALGTLEHEGWLYRTQGAGTFCADWTQDKPDKSTYTIGILTTYLSDYIFPSIIRGADAYLSERGYTILLAHTNNDVSKEQTCLENLISRQVDGLIIEPTRSALPNPNLDYYLNLERMGVPYVMINAFYKELEPFHVVMDDEQGAYLATEHLLELGHRHIAGFFKSDDLQGLHRMQGFLRAYQERELTVHEHLMMTYSTEEKREKPRTVLGQLLQLDEGRPTAIVCYNDESALDVMHVIREHQLHIPGDFSIVGFDDSHLAQASEVGLTTVKHPKDQMGQTAASLIVDLVENPKSLSAARVKVASTIFEAELVVRKSTARCGS